MGSCSRWGIAAATLISVLCASISLQRATAQVSSCTATYTCPAGVGACYSLLDGSQSTTRPVPGTFATENACTEYVEAANPHSGLTIACKCAGGTTAAGSTSTGSLTGDALNLGANMWIIQNVKNPYTAVFAQHFTQGFLTGLFSNNNSDPEAQRQQQLAYEAFQRQQQEAAERARIIEQQRIDAIYARLNSQLKLSGGVAQLALKTNGPLGPLSLKLSGSDPNGGLQLKLGDTPSPGYGISGLPGLNIGGPANTADNSGGLKFKLGDSSAAAPEPAQPVAPMGIPGLPGLNLDNVEPSQAAQLADTAANLPGPERSLVEDAALRAAQKDTVLSAPSDDPFVTDYQKQVQEYDVTQQQNHDALQQASEAQGHVEADQAAIAYAKGQIDQGNATDQQKQAFAQMQMAEGSDEQAAASARQVFEGTQIHLSISRDNAAGALAGLAPPPVGLAANAKPSQPSIAAVIPPRTSGNSAVTTVVLSPTSKPQLLAVSPQPGGRPYVMSVSECVASFSPKGDVPSLEELQKKLDSTMTAMEQIAKSQENANDVHNEWIDEMRKSVQDMGLHAIDHGVDGLFDSTKKGLDQTKKVLDLEAREVTYQGKLLHMEVAEAREAMNTAQADPGRLAALQKQWDAFDANQIKPLMARRKEIADEMAATELWKGRIDKFNNGRDFGAWWTDMNLPCNYSENEGFHCKNLSDNNATKAWNGDDVARADGLKQVLNYGAHHANYLAKYSQYLVVGSTAADLAAHATFIGEWWDATSLTIDLALDGTTLYLGNQQLQQVKQSNAQFAHAREVLSDRMDRLNATISCYTKASPTMEEAGR